MTRETFNAMTTTEKLEDLWEYMAHAFNVDADKEKDVEKIRTDKEEYADWERERFEDIYKEYQELLSQVNL